MKLAAKGPIAPPPKLPRAAERVAEQVRRWDGIICATHWYLFDRTIVDGVDFYVGDRELGHLHLAGDLHLGTTRTLRDALIPRGLARPLQWNPRGPWVEATIARVADVELGIWLFRLNYDRLIGVKTPVLLDRIVNKNSRPATVP